MCDKDSGVNSSPQYECQNLKQNVLIGVQGLTLQKNIFVNKHTVHYNTVM